VAPGLERTWMPEGGEPVIGRLGQAPRIPARMLQEEPIHA